MDEINSALNYSALRFWLDVVQWAATGMIAAWLMTTRGRKDNTEAITKLEKRIAKLETIQSQMPTHKDVLRIREEVSGLRSEIKSSKHLLEVVHQHLLDKGKHQ